jgi:hypothetical protein
VRHPAHFLPNRDRQGAANAYFRLYLNNLR